MIRKIWKCQPCHRRRGETREIKDRGRGRELERGEQAAEHPSQKERGLWGCSQGYRAKPGSVERQSEGGEGGSESESKREREREREAERGERGEKKRKGEGGRCRYVLYMREREREKQHVVKTESGKPIRGGDVREQ